MPSNTIVHEPGTLRAVLYHARRDENGNYPKVYWGTLDEQIADATQQNLENHSGSRHKPMELWTMADDCGHTNPEDDDKYDGVDDLLDAWCARNIPGLSYTDGNLYWINRKRGEQIIPEYAAFSQAMAEYEGNHNTVCYLNPQGTCCTGCTDGDDDYGYEPGSCYRQDDARAKQADFWDRFSPEGAAWLATAA